MSDDQDHNTGRESGIRQSQSDAAQQSGDGPQSEGSGPQGGTSSGEGAAGFGQRSRDWLHGQLNTRGPNERRSGSGTNGQRRQYEDSQARESDQARASREKWAGSEEGAPPLLRQSIMGPSRDDLYSNPVDLDERHYGQHGEDWLEKMGIGNHFAQTLLSPILLFSPRTNSFQRDKQGPDMAWWGRAAQTTTWGLGGAALLAGGPAGFIAGGALMAGTGVINWLVSRRQTKQFERVRLAKVLEDKVGELEQHDNKLKVQGARNELKNNFNKVSDLKDDIMRFGNGQEQRRESGIRLKGTGDLDNVLDMTKEQKDVLLARVQDMQDRLEAFAKKNMHDHLFTENSPEFKSYEHMMETVKAMAELLNSADNVSPEHLQKLKDQIEDQFEKAGRADKRFKFQEMEDALQDRIAIARKSMKELHEIEKRINPNSVQSYQYLKAKELQFLSESNDPEDRKLAKHNSLSQKGGETEAKEMIGMVRPQRDEGTSSSSGAPPSPSAA